MTAETVSESGFDWSSINMDDVEGESGPLKGSRSGTRTPSGTRRRRKSSQNKLDALQVTLSQQMFMGGAMIGAAMPVTGYYTCQESDRFTKALVELASHRPEWVEALEHLADLQPGIIIGRTAVGLGAALSVDRSIIQARRGTGDPERPGELANSQFMKFLGVYSAYMQTVDPGYKAEEGSAYRPPPASFAVID